MSFQGLAAFGLGAMQGYQNQNKENKREAERLADKDYQRSREKDQDGRVAAAEGRAVAADGRATQQFKMQQEASQITLDEAKLQNQINAGLRKATQAYSMGDKSGAFAALQETGNSLYPNMQMKFDQDEQGNIIVDANGAATGQRFTAQGVPIGQKITMKPEQAHQSLYAAMNPAKYVENQAAAAAEAAKAEREWQMHRQKGLFDNGIKLGQMGVQHTQNIERDNNTGQNNILRDQMKPQTAAGGASKPQIMSVLRGGSSSGGQWSAIPDRLPEGVTPRQMAEAIAPFMQQIESSNNPNAVSPKGARGLMQIMPKTRDEILQKTGIDANRSPEDNQRAGAWYLEQKIIETKGNVRLALAAYNAGSGNVQKHGGVPPFKETQNYLTKINNLIAAQNGAIGNLRQNENVAAAVTNNLKIISDDLSKQLKDNDVTISPAKIQAALGIAGRSLVEMSRKTNPADQQKAFRAAMDHIKIRLLGSMTDLDDAEKEVYAQHILSQLIGESSDQSMNNLVFDADGQALAAVNARMSGGQPNPFEGTVGIQAPAKPPTTSQALAAHAQGLPAPATKPPTPQQVAARKTAMQDIVGVTPATTKPATGSAGRATTPRTVSQSGALSASAFDKNAPPPAPTDMHKLSASADSAYKKAESMYSKISEATNRLRRLRDSGASLDEQKRAATIVQQRANSYESALRLYEGVIRSEESRIATVESRANRRSERDASERAKTEQLVSSLLGE